MSNSQNQSSDNQAPDPQGLDSSTPQNSTSDGQKRSAPDHPPATPPSQRTSAVNFGDNPDDIVYF